MRTEPTTSLSTIVLEALDGAWDPILARLDGITDDEYLWEPTAGCWSVRQGALGWVADWSDDDTEHELDPGPVTTIAWRCWHTAIDALDSYSDRLFDRTGNDLTGLEWVPTASEAVAALTSSWTVFRDGVAAWSDSDLFTPLGWDWEPFEHHSHLDLVFHALHEVTHHGAEIALLRDLYRARDAG